MNFKKIVKKYLYKAGYEINRHQDELLHKAVVSIKPDISKKGDALISYIIEPWISKKNPAEYKSHTHFWESAQIAKIFLDMGYAVDAIDYRNRSFIPYKKYSFFVGARTNFERLSKLVNQNCKKIVHLDTAHWAFNNHASYTRLRDFMVKKNFCPKNSIRTIEQNSAIEHADCATILGNEFTQETYKYAEKPMYRIPISTCTEYAWNVEKDFRRCAKNYLWFGSAGAIHRGLDILIDVFVDMPSYKLYICGPIDREVDFISYYKKQLYSTPNIYMLGWMDVTSKNFLNILNECSSIIFPSCAEGGGGSVINCMHAGLIPIVSRESSVDIDNFGYILGEISVHEIKKLIESIAKKSHEHLKEMSRESWEFARARHTRETFTKAFKKAIDKISTDS